MDNSSEIMVHILHFSIEGIRGALPLDDTMYLVRMAQPDPGSNDSFGVVGTLNLHGIRVPVYSLRKLFGFPDRFPRLTDNLIITKAGLSEVALWVEETFVVQDNGEMLNNTAHPTVQSIIPGITILSDGLVLIHDLLLFFESCKTGDQTSISSLVKKTSNFGVGTVDQGSFFGESRDPELARQILVERALELAKPEDAPSETLSIEILKFRLVYQEYAVEMRFVREVVLTREITPVPGTPDHVIGVCPVRGEIIPLVDLRVLLSIPEKGLTDLNQVIVLSDGIITFGILADQITGIRTIPVDKIQTTDSFLSSGKPGFFLGVDLTGLIVINAAAILSDPKMVVDHSGESENPATGSLNQS